MKSPRRLDNRTMCVKIIATLVPARAKHQARLNALPSAAESQQSDFLLRRQSRATPLGRALVCEYKPGRPGFKSFPSEKGKVLIKRVQ